MGKEVEVTSTYRMADLNVDGVVNSKDLFILYASKYENGTLIKGSDETVYVMMGGVKRPIPENTLKNLGLTGIAIETIPDKELSLIPEGYSLPEIKYPNGTLVKGSGPNVYLIQGGLRRLIPDKTTFESLGFEWNRVKTIQTNELSLIAEGEPIPAIKYRNGTLLEGPDGKTYIMAYGCKVATPEDKLIRDELGIGLKERTITIRAGGKADRGACPLIQLRVDGVIAREWFVSSGYQDYTVSLPLTEGEHQIDLFYVNDMDYYTQLVTEKKTKTSLTGKTTTTVEQRAVSTPIADRTLWIDYIKVDDMVLEAENREVAYDIGRPYALPTFTDGKGVTSNGMRTDIEQLKRPSIGGPGFSRYGSVNLNPSHEFDIPGARQMLWSGALRFKVNIDTALKLPSGELEAIPSGGEIPRIIYPNGTLMRDKDGSGLHYHLGHKEAHPGCGHLRRPWIQGGSDRCPAFLSGHPP